MRKHHIKSLMGIIETMYQGIKQIGKEDFERNAVTSEILRTMSETTLQIKSFISENGDGNAKNEANFEEFARLCGQALTDEGFGYDSVKVIKKLLGEIKCDILSIKPSKIEVAFFPYKAAMGDSLESIYLAAKADPSCDAYWIPVPFFEVNCDGSLGEMRYEGGDYPDYIEITDWQAYDVEARHPDVIFIHNPYDDCNNTTNVHHSYHTGRLRDLTDLLVHIDYGLLIRVPRTPVPPKLDKNKQMTVVPGYYNVDKIVSYSSEWRDQIKCSVAEWKKYFITPKTRPKPNVGDKYVALGSPKFDKILNFTRDDYPLPAEWVQLISAKKVVLFCTSLTPALGDVYKHLKRHDEIFNIFRGRDDIVLWWRPHPLILQALKSNYGDAVASRYARIVEQYKLDGFGIYDDTPDMHRAIQWSDAYYGDESSLVYLYLATGKPFTITTKLNESDWFTKDTNNFKKVLQWRINNMKNFKGANKANWNVCIWWANFCSNKEEDKFLENFLHYVTHTEEYPNADEYRRLQLQMFRDFVVNPDGTAGEKIYEHCKNAVLSGR